MHLSSLAVSHYRGFESALIDLPASGIVLVVGPNNAGKSALLAALDVVAGSKPGERMAREGSSEEPRIGATFTLTDAERVELLGGEGAAERWPSPWFGQWRLSFQAATPEVAYTSDVELLNGDEPDRFVVFARQRRDTSQNFGVENLDLGGVVGSYPGGVPSWDLVDSGSRSGGAFDVLPNRSDLRVLAQLLYEQVRMHTFAPLILWATCFWLWSLSFWLLCTCCARSGSY